MIFKHITKTVWYISLISLFNDFSSEMLYPIIPMYLQQVGYGTWAIGVLEGIAELVAGFSKIALGRLSDVYNRRLPFVQLGYFLSVVSRPLIGLTSYLGVIFTARSLDRIGKGIRGGARDAMLDDACEPEHRAEVFGFHRSMDTLGAVFGPLTALVFLYFRPADYKSLFLLSILPGLVALIIGFKLKEKSTNPLQVKPNVQKLSAKLKTYFLFYKTAPKGFLNWLGIFFVFALVNSSDMFLLLRAKESGVSETTVLQLYMWFNLCFALTSYPIGRISKHVGLKPTFQVGLICFSLSYIILASISPLSSTLILFLAFTVYGLYYAFTQGIVKTILLNQVNKESKASAIGLYEGLNSFGLLISNIVTGLCWYKFGAESVLWVIGFIVMLISLVLSFKKNKFN